jgi:oxalate decarboxylase/phosphoglucose isomerase-like protein (cupin superfamily)
VSLAASRLLPFPRVPDERGTLAVIEGGQHVPFDVRRVFYVYGVPAGTTRGAHAHRELEQVLVCLTGSMDVVLDDGHGRRTVHLADPAEGLYIPPLVWASERNMAAGTVYMVLASAPYDESDYFRDYAQFLEAIHDHATGDRQ